MLPIAVLCAERMRSAILGNHLKRHGESGKRSRMQENDSNDSDFPLKLMEKTTNGMDIG